MRCLSVCLVLSLAGAVSAQDITLSQVLEPEQGWRPVKGVHSTPGPMAADRAGNVYVADAGKKVIQQIGRDGTVRPFAKTSDVVGGLAFGEDDLLVATLPARQQIVRYDAQGKEEVVHHKTPARDLAVRAGRMYYTAPEKMAVFLVGRSEPVARDLGDPSGIAFWNDGATLVVGDAAGKHLVAFRIQPDGGLDAGERYYALYVRPKEASGVRALSLDVKGLLFAATREGVQVFDPTGRLFGVLLRPERHATTALAFGGAERDHLFIVCGGKVWERKTRVKGAPASGTTAR